MPNEIAIQLDKQRPFIPMIPDVRKILKPIINDAAKGIPRELITSPY